MKWFKLDKLSQGVRAGIQQLEPYEKEFRINYTEYLYNPTRVVLVGIPEEGFLDVTRAVISGCKTRGIPLTMPPNALMTVARFAAKNTSARAMDRLCTCVARARGPGIMQPSQVEVGYFSFASVPPVSMVYDRIAL